MRPLIRPLLVSLLVPGLLFGPLAGCAGSVRPTPSPSPTDPRLTSSDLKLRAHLDADEPGCSAAVGIDGRVAWSGARGVADLRTGAALTPESVFDIGSVSKQFTAVAILLLAAERRISVDDTVSEYLPGLPAWAGRVRISHLLHHTSGLPDYHDLLRARGYPHTRRTTQAQAVAAVAQTSGTRFRPGTAFQYSNSNYLLLAEIVRRVSGTPLSAFLTERVFAPLGLRMAVAPLGDVPGRVPSYLDTQDGRGPQPVRWPWEQIGDGAIQTTPGELVRWADNYRTGAVGGKSLLDGQVADLVATDFGPGLSYGAGIVVFDNRMLGHEGSWEGFRTAFQITPDRRTAFAVACNSADRDPGGIVSDLREIWS